MQRSASCAHWLQTLKSPFYSSVLFQRQYLTTVFLLGTALPHLGMSSGECFLKTLRGIKGKERGEMKENTLLNCISFVFFFIYS